MNSTEIAEALDRLKTASENPYAVDDTIACACGPEDIKLVLSHLADRAVAAQALATALRPVAERDPMVVHGPCDPFVRISTPEHQAIRQFVTGVPATGPLKLDTDKQVFFYEQDFYVLSNFSSFRVLYGSTTYGLHEFDTSEHAYHFQRFCYPDGVSPSEAIMARGAILRATSAHDAFKIAQAEKHHQRPDWDTAKITVMRDILRAKVHQHEYVRRKLLATGDRELIENSWRDDFWGWGENRDGQNMLGKLWMEVRAEIRAAQPAEGA